MTFASELSFRLLADYFKPEQIMGANGSIKLQTKKLVGFTLQARMAEH